MLNVTISLKFKLNIKLTVNWFTFLNNINILGIYTEKGLKRVCGKRF